MLRRKIPVTVITGFLGAGKTTLVNQLLASHPNQAIGVVVNEYGEVGVDGDLIDADADAILEIRNGCVCCTVRADLVGSVLRLLDRAGPSIDRLVIETSGLADPAPVLQSFLADAALRERVHLESVVTLVDAVHAASQRGDGIACEQIAFADLLVITKADRVDAAALAALQRELQRANPTATMALAERGLATEPIFGVDRFSLANLLAVEPDLLGDAPHAHEHDDSVQAFSIVEPGSLDAERFNRWMNALVQAHGVDLLRMKGIVSFLGEARRYHFHSVHMLLETTPGRRWSAGERRETRLVFIGRHLDAAAITRQFQACMAHAEPEEREAA